MSEQITTETGINITDYIGDKTKGIVSITKPIKASGNYVFMRANWMLGVDGNGQPSAVEAAPTLQNINRGSIDDLESKLKEQEDQIALVRQQLAAITADMDALDAQP